MSQGYQSRPGYLPSVGSPARTIPFDSYWRNLSYAQSLAGIWDSPSGSPDTQIVVSDNQVVGGSDKYLVRQFVFPPFGSSIDKLVVPVSPGQSTYTVSPGPGMMGKTSLIDPLTNAYELRFVNSARVFSTSNVFKYYVKSPPISANANFTSKILKGIVSSLGTNLTRNVPLSTDFLVIEVGLFAASFLTPITYDVTFQFGDGHPTNVLTNSTIIGNSWMNFRYWTVLGGSGWQLNEA